MADEDKRSSHTFNLRDVITILLVIVPMAVTWGVYTTKMSNLSAHIIDLKADNVIIKNRVRTTKSSLKHENDNLRSKLSQIEIEVSNNRINLSNLRDRIKEIIEANNEKRPTK